MATMNVSLPDHLKDFVEERVGTAHYTSSSEYIRELIRYDHARQQLRTMLADASAAADWVPDTPGRRAAVRHQLRAE